MICVQHIILITAGFWLISGTPDVPASPHSSSLSPLHLELSNYGQRYFLSLHASAPLSLFNAISLHFSCSLCPTKMLSIEATARKNHYGCLIEGKFGSRDGGLGRCSREGAIRVIKPQLKTLFTPTQLPVSAQSRHPDSDGSSPSILTLYLFY